jgi:HSP20 family protein
MYTYTYRPVRLADAMNRLFEDSFVQPGWNGSREAGMAVPVDVLAEADSYVLTAVVPGLRSEDLSLEVLGDTVTLRGEVAGPEAEKDGSYLLRERRTGKFERSFTFPAELNAAEAQAALENGILTLRLAKAEAAKRKTIKVNAR